VLDLLTESATLDEPVAAGKRRGLRRIESGFIAFLERSAVCG